MRLGASEQPAPRTSKRSHVGGRSDASRRLTERLLPHRDAERGSARVRARVGRRAANAGLAAPEQAAGAWFAAHGPDAVDVVAGRDAEPHRHRAQPPASADHLRRRTGDRRGNEVELEGASGRSLSSSRKDGRTPKSRHCCRSLPKRSGRIWRTFTPSSACIHTQQPLLRCSLSKCPLRSSRARPSQYPRVASGPKRGVSRRVMKVVEETPDLGGV
jgi:hypothetical protein